MNLRLKEGMNRPHVYSPVCKCRNEAALQSSLNKSPPNFLYKCEESSSGLSPRVCELGLLFLISYLTDRWFHLSSPMHGVMKAYMNGGRLPFLNTPPSPKNRAKTNIQLLLGFRMTKRSHVNGVLK